MIATLASVAAAGPVDRASDPDTPQRVLFAPVPPKPASRASLTTPDGSADYMDLFLPGAPWTTAASRVTHFKIHGWMIRLYFTDEELITIANRLQELEIALMVEAEPLDPPDEDRCDHTESYEGPYELMGLERLRDLGITVDSIAVEQPFSFGHRLQEPRACRYTAAEVAEEVATWATSARRIYPGVEIGSIEGLALKYNTSATSMKTWITEFEKAFGEPLAFLHLDADWEWARWPQVAFDVEQMAKSEGVPFGLIYNGQGVTSSDADWIEAAAERMAIYELDIGGKPNDLIIQSWHDLPDRVLPEDNPATLTSLVNRYFGHRVELSPPTVIGYRGLPFPPTIRGRLTTTDGAPVPGVRVTVEATNIGGERQPHVLRGTVPSGATQAVIGVRVNVEGAVPGEADIRLYSASYVDGTSTANRVSNPDFFSGVLHPWGAYGPTPSTVTLVPNDTGFGRMVRLQATEHQQAFLDSARFSVTAGTAYELETEFAVPAASHHTGYLAVVFLDATGAEVRRDPIDFVTAPSVARTAVTESSGWYNIHAPSLRPGMYVVTADVPGDLTNWPASATNTSGY